MAEEPICSSTESMWIGSSCLHAHFLIVPNSESAPAPLLHPLQLLLLLIVPALAAAP